MSGRADFLEVAAAIGDRLCRDAFWDGRRCTWSGATLEPVAGQWTVVWRSFGPLLYDGSSGVALFLAELARATGDAKYRDTAIAGFAQAFSRLDEIPVHARGGLYSGYAGIALAAVRAGRLLDVPTLIADGLGLAEALAGDDPTDHAVDVVSGAAGAIPALLALYRLSRHPLLLAAALRYGDELIARARRDGAGWSWAFEGNPPDGLDLTGFSHGTAGIATALLELGHASGVARFHAAAEAAFAYERAWYDPTRRNWPDLRGLKRGSARAAATIFPVYWCHGGAGVGYSRLRAVRTGMNGVVRDEAIAAVETTHATLASLEQGIPGSAEGGNPGAGFDRNFSLCHGRGGNADLLIYAAEVLGDPRHFDAARRVGEIGRAQYGDGRVTWPCGVPGGGETSGLMLGIAGIGYFYLRLHDPRATPSMLVIEPERALDAGIATP